MKTRDLVLSCAIATALCLSTTSVLGKTASCPCSPCKCSPCTCGGSGSSKGGKHHDKEHGHGHSGSSVSVGGTVDLGVIGHRSSEPDPFAAGGGEKPVAHTQEKKTAKKPEQSTATTFDKVELTSEKAKDTDSSDKPPGTEGGQTFNGGAVNVSNDTPTPGPGTQEKKKKIGKKKKKKWPKPIQDWVDTMHAANTAQQSLQWEQSSYYWALIGYCAKNSKHWSELRDACTEAQKKAKADGATQADKDNADKVCTELKKQEDELAKDFNKTEAGQKASDKVNEAQKAADKANGEEKEAGKNIDQATKDAVNEDEKQHPPVRAVW
jgi:hypothetical protein